MSEYLLGKPIHKSKFDRTIDWEDEKWKPMLEDLILTIDESIVAVRSHRVDGFFLDPEVRKMRMGMLPIPKSFKIETQEDFFKMLAVFVPIEETC